MDPYKLRPRNEFHIHKKGLKKNYLTDNYHSLMKMSWLEFILLFISSYLLINCLFASLYYFTGDNILNAQNDSFWDAFVFSFQTSATIGYGYLLPKTTLANIIVVFDAISGVLFVAIATGLAFAKFSRPSGRVLFTKNMILTKFDGQDVLMFRIGNARNSKVIDAHIKVVLSRPELTKEGISMRRMHNLKLTRESSPLFSLSWTVMHVIDEDSPMRGYDFSTISSEDINFIISLTGIDDVFSAVVYDRCIYLAKDIVFAKSFQNIMETNKKGELVINYACFHEVNY